jgi:hypothetical protein
VADFACVDGADETRGGFACGETEGAKKGEERLGVDGKSLGCELIV